MSVGDVSQPIAATTLVSGESIPDSERRDKGVYDVSRGHVSPEKRVYVRILPLCVTLGFANLLDAAY